MFGQVQRGDIPTGEGLLRFPLQVAEILAMAGAPEAGERFSGLRQKAVLSREHVVFVGLFWDLDKILGDSCPEN